MLWCSDTCLPAVYRGLGLKSLAQGHIAGRARMPTCHQPSSQGPTLPAGLCLPQPLAGFPGPQAGATVPEDVPSWQPHFRHVSSTLGWLCTRGIPDGCHLSGSCGSATSSASEARPGGFEQGEMARPSGQPHCALIAVGWPSRFPGFSNPQAATSSIPTARPCTLARRCAARCPWSTTRSSSRDASVWWPRPGAPGRAQG